MIPPAPLLPADNGGQMVPQPTSSNGYEPALFHRDLAKRPYRVESGSEIYLHLEGGRTIIDACGGAAVASIGHGNKEVVAAVIEQMRRISYVHTMAYTTDSAEQLAHILLDDNPFGLTKAFFVGSGADANESAMKLARQYFHERGEASRRHFIARRQAFHGCTIGAISISSHLARRAPFDPQLLLPHISHVSPAVPYHDQRPDEDEDGYAARLAEELDAEIRRVGPDTVAAFVAETVAGSTSGCAVAPRGYFRRVREVCDRYGVLLILDEVMCGSGRTGTFFAFEQEDVVPDIVAIAKSLGGGYAPCAAIVVHERVMAPLKQGSKMFCHGHTYQAHPVSCAAALAVQRIVRRDGLLERCKKMGELLGKKLRRVFEGRKYVGDVRGRGLFWAIEFVEDRDSKTPFPAAVGFGPLVQEKAFDMGVAVYPGQGTVDGISGDHVLLAPPYNITVDELNAIVEILRQAYDAAEKEVDGR